LITTGASFLTHIIDEFMDKSNPEVMIENRLGIFKCRKDSCDIGGVAEGTESDFTKYLLTKQPRVFLDVGANIGRYTISMAKRSGKVIAFECDPENFAQLQENIALNGRSNIIAVERACWFEETIKPMNIAPLDEKSLSSLKVGETGRRVDVRCSTIDSVLKELGIRSVDLVKMDIEGAEKEAILGLKETIANSPEIEILFESINEQYVRECRDALKQVGITQEPVQIGGMYKVVKC
jgi:FkbM family methyltransferase